MKALILSAGVSSRLRPLTEDKHKGLLEVGGKKIIDRQLELLKKHGIRDIIIVVGYHKDKLTSHVKNAFPDLSFTFIENPDYASTNCIYSLWLARDHLKDDLIYMAGDIVMEEGVLGKILKSKNGSVIYVNKNKLPKKDFKARVEGEFVKEIAVNTKGSGTYGCFPLLKMEKKGVELWLKAAEELINSGQVNIYEMDAFNKVSEDIHLKPEYINEFCMEVDDHDDLAVARAFFSK